MNFRSTIYNGKIKIRNIIFDWGGVITDLHMDATKNAFIKLGLPIFDESVPHDPGDELFVPFETGRISATQFRSNIRKNSAAHITDAEIDQAWNALLGDLPEERWKILESTSRSYHTFLLSNTNSIHVSHYYNELLKKYGTYGYAHFFEKTYFSFELGMRKPNADIFKFVIADAGINPNETMFIDDFIENIETAKWLGFQTIHLKAPLTLADIFE